MSSSAFCTALCAFILQSAFCQLCDWGWLPYENQCYRYSEGNIEYGQAQEYCRSRRATLVEYLPDELKDRFLKVGDKSEAFDYWCHTKQETLNALILSRRKRNSVKSCCIVNNRRREDGNCGNIRRYICVMQSTRIPDGCDEDTTEPEHLVWDDARNHCQCSGGDLYSFKERKDMDEFLMLAQDMSESLWIGLRMERGDVFRWSDGSPVSDFVLQAVNPQAEDDQLCISYNVGDSLWEATNCFEELQFICKKQDLTTSATQDLTTEDLTTSSTEDLTTADLTTSTTQDLTTEDLTTSSTEDLITTDLTTSTSQDLISRIQDFTNRSTVFLSLVDVNNSTAPNLISTNLTTSTTENLSTNLTPSSTEDSITNLTSSSTEDLSTNLISSTIQELTTRNATTLLTEDSLNENCNNYIWVIGMAILVAVCVLTVVNLCMIRRDARKRGSLDIKCA